MAINGLNDYSFKKSKDLITIQKTGDDNYAIETKIFSSVDGSELPSQTVGVTMTELAKEISKKESELTELNLVKDDFLNT